LLDSLLQETTYTMNEFPDFEKFKSLAEFGYAFTETGEMRQISSGAPFQFVVKPGDHTYNQKHYEALGEIITEEVYRLLETQAGLERHYLNDHSFVFASKDFQSSDRLLCLIHGSGVVRAGQWTRKLIINNDLDKGTQLPYIREAISLGFGVVVFNTNQNRYTTPQGSRRRVSDSADPEEHAATVWQRLIAPSRARHIVIVAHSYGGVVVSSLAQHAKRDFMERVVGVLLTDSVHYSLTKSRQLNARLIDISKNYVASDMPVGEVISSAKNDIRRISAGHTQHEWTSWAAMLNIFADIKIVMLKASPVWLAESGGWQPTANSPPTEVSAAPLAKDALTVAAVEEELTSSTACHPTDTNDNSVRNDENAVTDNECISKDSTVDDENSDINGDEMKSQETTEREEEDKVVLQGDVKEDL